MPAPYPTLRRGSSGTYVKTLQRILGVDRDGTFGPATEAAVRRFQALNGLTADGIVGPDTWNALSATVTIANAAKDATNGAAVNGTTTFAEPPRAMTRAEKIIAAAKRFDGQREKPGNRGFWSAWFDKAMRAVGFRDGDPWCSHAAELVWTEGYSDDPAKQKEIARVWSGSGKQLIANARAAGWPVKDYPVPGAVGVLDYGGWKSHVYIVGLTVGKNYWESWEGNTSEAGSREGTAFLHKRRGRDGRPHRGFIHPI